MRKDIKLLFSFTAITMFISGGSYLLATSFIKDSILYWIVGCFGFGLGMVGLINIQKEIGEEKGK